MIIFCNHFYSIITLPQGCQSSIPGKFPEIKKSFNESGFRIVLISRNNPNTDQNTGRLIMIRTTINIDTELLKKLEKAAGTLRLSNNEMISLLNPH